MNKKKEQQQQLQRCWCLWK